MAMYYQHLKTKAEDFEFMAICHGAKPSKKTVQNNAPSEPIDSGNLLFGDPEDYKKLPEEEREANSKEMKNKFKALFGQTHMVPSGGVGKIQRW